MFAQSRNATYETTKNRYCIPTNISLKNLKRERKHGTQLNSKLYIIKHAENLNTQSFNLSLQRTIIYSANKNGKTRKYELYIAYLIISKLITHT